MRLVGDNANIECVQEACEWRQKTCRRSEGSKMVVGECFV